MYAQLTYLSLSLPLLPCLQTPHRPATCARIKRVLRITSARHLHLPPPLHGDISIRAADLPPHLQYMNQSISNVPVPDAIDSDREIKHAFYSFYRKVCLFHIPHYRTGKRRLAGVSTPYASKVTFTAQHAHLIFYEQHMRKISITRYHQLKAAYFSTKAANPSLHATLNVRSLHEELAKLAFRYHSDTPHTSATPPATSSCNTLA